MVNFALCREPDARFQRMKIFRPGVFGRGACSAKTRASIACHGITSTRRGSVGPSRDLRRGRPAEAARNRGELRGTGAAARTARPQQRQGVAAA